MPKRLLQNRRFRRIAPFAISGVLVLALIAYAPWSEIGSVISNVHYTTFIYLFTLSLTYYGLKAFRFWYLLKAIDIKLPFRVVAISYISAQPASLLPGGEVFRSHALAAQTGVPVRKTIAQFTTQGILEGAGLATVMLVSALMLHTVRIAAIILSILVAIALIGLARGYMAPFLKVMNKLPFINLSYEGIHHFSERHQIIFSPRWFPRMYALSLVTELIGTAIAYVSMTGLGGHINLYQAGLLYSIPIVIGFISLLPGGVGLSEQSAIGVLLLAHVTVARAVAATLLMRVTIVGLGVLYGCIALALGQRRLAKQIPR